MKEVLKQIKIEFIIESIIVIVLGIIFLGWAPVVIPLMAKILAVFLVVIGLVFVVSFIMKKVRLPYDSVVFVAGIVIAAVGVWIFLYPNNFTNLIPKIFGVLLILSGVRNLGHTITLIKCSYKFWWVVLLLAIGVIAIGVWLILKSQEANEMVVRIIGASLIYNGISNIWTMTRVRLFAKAVDREIRDLTAVDSSEK